MSSLREAAVWLVWITCGSLLATTAHATDYHVSTSGSDLAAGTSGQPWRTIQKAANTVVAGDNVFIHGGVYAERVTLSGKSGTSVLPISFESASGEQAIVDQDGVTPPNGDSALLLIQNCNFITIRGVEFRNYKTVSSAQVPMGIFITGACNGVRLEQNKVHAIWQSNPTLNSFAANAHGIAAYGNAATAIDNIVLDGNEVYDLRLGASEAVVLNGNVTNFQVVRNVVHDCNNIGIDFIGFEGVNGNVSLDQARNGLCAQNEVYNIDTQYNPAYGGDFAGIPDVDERNDARAAAGIYVDGGANITIERNHVHDCNFGMEVASEHFGKNASGVIVRNNLLRANHVGGLFIGGAGSGNGGVTNCSFTHNTLYQNDTASYGGGQIDIQHHVSSTIIRHNIIVCDPVAAQFVLYEASDGSFAANAIDWNLYSGAPANGAEFAWSGTTKSSFSSWQAVVPNQDAHSFFAASPGFVNAAANNFNLQSSAAAVNAGDPSFSPAAGELDYGGLDRLVNGRVDIGMDEFGVNAPVVQFDVSSYAAVAENAGPITARIVRSGDATVAFDVTFATRAVGDTAVADTDYTPHSGTTVHFNSNQTEATVPVQLIDRPGVQGSRIFTVKLSAPTDGASLGAKATATATIKDAAGALAINLPAASTIDVNENAGPVQIPITRTSGADGAVGFSITASNGTATVGTDFTTPVTPQSLANGVTAINVPVGIVNSTTTESDETFTVTISAPTGGATLGAVTSVTVRIVDVDVTSPPAPVITSPAVGAGIGVNSGASINLTGTATDNKSVSSVKVNLNNAGAVDATLGAPGTASTSWSLAVVPVSGTNTLAVQSFDARGNASAVVTRTFTVLRPLVVNADASLGSVTTGFSPSSFREVGKSFTITATPKPMTTTPPFQGAIFTGWTITGATNAQLGIVESAKEKQTLTFISRDGVVLTANFMLNPFPPMAGSYNGLIRPSANLPDRAPSGAGGDDGTARTNATEGRFAATVQSTGAFSGMLTIDGLTLGVAGAFDKDGNARFGTARLLTQTVARTGKPSLVVALHLDMVTPGVNDTITGTVTATDFKQSVVTAVSEVESDRAFYNGTTLLVPAAYLGAANANGVFTAVFPAKAVASQTAGFTAQDYPQGDGTGTVTVTKAGDVTLAGTLADGTAFSASSALSQTNRFPLFAQLYSKLGFLSGFVQLDDAQSNSDMAAADLQWLRPFMTTTQYYPSGWPEGIRVDLMAAKYAAVAGQSVLKAPGGAGLQGPDADGNATLTFSDGKLSETLPKTANLSTADVVTKVPDNDPTFTLAINRITGGASGSFTHTDDSVSIFNAIMYQKGAQAGAYGYFLTKQPVPIDYTGESGAVTLIGDP